MLMEREGNWPGALAAHDLALLHGRRMSEATITHRGNALGGRTATHLRLSSTAATAAAEAEAGHAEALRMHLGVASALDHMGCGYAAASYLRGIGGCFIGSFCKG